MVVLGYVQCTCPDGRVVKAVDLSSTGGISAWVRTPLLACLFCLFCSHPFSPPCSLAWSICLLSSPHTAYMWLDGRQHLIDRRRLQPHSHLLHHAHNRAELLLLLHIQQQGSRQPPQPPQPPQPGTLLHNTVHFASTVVSRHPTIQSSQTSQSMSTHCRSIRLVFYFRWLRDVHRRRGSSDWMASSRLLLATTKCMHCLSQNEGFQREKSGCDCTCLIGCSPEGGGS